MNIPTDKPVILAICGASATGKTQLSRWLADDLFAKKFKVHRIVSDTTRPIRKNEIPGVDYNFVSENLFAEREHLETSCFNSWWYGTPTAQNFPGLNVGVFNAEGMKSLLDYRRKYHIIPIYLKEKPVIRLRRSYDREGKWKLEYLRRLIADKKDFKNFEKNFLPLFPQMILLNNIDGVVRKTQIIYKQLECIF